MTAARKDSPDAIDGPKPTSSARPGPAVEQRDQVIGGNQSASVSLFDPTLDVLACAVDDLETLRIALQNRLRSLTCDDVFGLDETHPAVKALAAQLASLEALEHGAVLAMGRQFRTHPLYPWVKVQRGLGDKQTARLLSAIKDPYWNDLHERPRTVSELWAFSGYKPGQRRRKGQQSNWSADAKVRAYLIAESCMKAGGPYRAVYDQRKAYTEGRLHAEPCVRCGPSGKPAQPGSPWSDGHRHADALRVTAKVVLRALWTEAKRIHEATA